ncbi:MAG: threonine aldolase, partial [Actinomycetota bacterium]
ANAMASRLHDGVGDLSGVTITQSVDANAVFVLLPEQVASRLQEPLHFYPSDQATGEVRWMSAWDTTESDVVDFVAAVRGEIAPGA